MKRESTPEHYSPFYVGLCQNKCQKESLALYNTDNLSLRLQRSLFIPNLCGFILDLISKALYLIVENIKNPFDYFIMY